MPRLEIKSSSESFGMRDMTVTGFTDAEMNELLSMDHKDAEQKILEMLDERNNGTGTCWHNGYGVYGFRLGTGGCTFTVGTSCD